MADRRLRVKSLIGKNISDILSFELKNPRIGLPSVSETVVTDDYSVAKVYVTFLGSRYPEQNLRELRHLTGVVRSKLAKKMDLRKVPEIEFYIDDRYERAERLEKALEKEEEDLKRLETGRDDLD